MFEEEIKYIRERLKDIGLFEYQEIKNEFKFLIIANSMYSFSIRYINNDNLRCELNKKEVMGGVVFAGKIMTSCIISKWQNREKRIKHVEDWIENFLIIPEIKLLLRNKKINKIKDKC